jgi:hypothetical protein
MRLACSAMIVVLVCGAQVSAATTFYVDPATGQAGGDGSKEKPWKTLAEVISSGAMNQVKPGDTILLRTGYHGLITLGGANTDFITIAAEKGQKPTLSRLTITSGTKWRIRGLTISPSCGDKPYEGYIVTYAEGGVSSELVIEDCFIYTELDSSQWDVAKWLKANSGVCMGRYGKQLTLRNNYILNIRYGISLTAEDSLCEGNVVSDFSADGMDLVRDGQTVQYNVVKNNYLSAADGDTNHDDGIQCYLFNVGTGTVRRATVIGNIIINRENDAQKYPNPLQGLGFFDGPLVDFVITDNVVLVDMFHGIALNDAQNARIERNVCWTRWGSGRGHGRPGIQIGKNPQKCVIRNNFALSYDFKPGPEVVSENNGNSSQQIFDQAMARAYQKICEKFGRYHPVAGYDRLGTRKGKNPEPAEKTTSALSHLN